MNFVLLGILLICVIFLGIFLTFVVRSIVPLSSYNTTLTLSTRIFLTLLAVGVICSGIMILVSTGSPSEEAINQKPIIHIY